MEIRGDSIKRRSHGFTLTEMLVVLSIIGILISIALPSYAFLKTNVALQNETDYLISELQSSQASAIASRGNEDHGVHFETDRYMVYAGTVVTGIEHLLPDGMEILAGAGSDVLFDRLSGTSNAVSVTIGYPSGSSRSISVDVGGNIKRN